MFQPYTAENIKELLQIGDPSMRAAIEAIAIHQAAVWSELSLFPFLPRMVSHCQMNRFSLNIC